MNGRNQGCIIPTWEGIAPSNVKAFTTTRKNGVSKKPFDSFNLAMNIGDKRQDVSFNRERLKATFSLPTEPCWLNQNHSNAVIQLTQQKSHIVYYGKNNANQDKFIASSATCADAAYTYDKNIVSCVLTADCLPILICNLAGTMVAAIHAGWRGIAAGIIERTIKATNIDPCQIIAWLGPAIGPTAFEVKQDVVDHFASNHLMSQAFTSHNQTHYQANIYYLARLHLVEAGLAPHFIFGGDYCTYEQSDLFFSYRRDKITGRMASLIWME